MGKISILGSWYLNRACLLIAWELDLVGMVSCRSDTPLGLVKRVCAGCCVDTVVCDSFLPSGLRLSLCCRKCWQLSALSWSLPCSSAPPLWWLHHSSSPPPVWPCFSTAVALELSLVNLHTRVPEEPKLRLPILNLHFSAFMPLKEDLHVLQRQKDNYCLYGWVLSCY